MSTIFLLTFFHNFVFKFFTIASPLYKFLKGVFLLDLSLEENKHLLRFEIDFDSLIGWDCRGHRQ